ncbi:D-alanyl-D-alanine carboxypeptidase [Streptomyces sp. ALI-76-A]|uniref:D-alanyl-D-alanine carboxypeptidase n=1 Tax=Streptomyces sp. ALI-76-A TaxID=3025736 RepID=UPI00256E9E24|nr:D-alanyl-D-alanine carboxypeptidase [Streptomyces sp. ALI-76-A]MDL5202154.1 D-alanyl-D-alanine carboxypeptidase [Streptomyces sp. ALI-76-A]
MEEASVAGESPDRSKQQESSAEPTSGSAGPVPEARNESGAPRDPRLAVAREAKAAPAARGGVDTATRVLSVRELAEAAQGPVDAPQDAPQEAPGEAEDTEAAREAGAARSGDVAAQTTDAPAEGDSKTADDSGDSGDSGDRDPRTAAGSARLRDAVAAWVASADEKPAADADATDQAGEPEDAIPDADATDDADEPEDAIPDTDATDDAGEPEDAEPEDAIPDADATDDTGEPEDAEPEDAIPDADATDDTGEPEDAIPDTDATDDAGEPEDAIPDADATDDAGEPEDAVEPASGGEAESSRGVEDEAEPAAEAKAADEAKAAGDAEAEADDIAVVADTPVNAHANTATDTEPEPDTEPGPEPDKSPADARDQADADADAETATATDQPPAPAKPAVDQATAVFKTVRPSAPAVDQPTTMLKFGGATKDKPEPESGVEPKAEPQSKAEPEPEAKPASDAERTSKFVALKPLDEPSARRPQAADATAALPQVTAAGPQPGPERTTQQPLPPKPPLDLLAELTNTPPPAETPVRTAVRRVKIWTPLVLLLVVVFAVVQAVRPLPAPELQLTAEDSYTFEGGKAEMPWPADGQAAVDVQGIGTFGSSGEQKPVPIASVAKVMTAYVILRDHPLKSGADGPKIEIDQAAEDQSDAGQESTVDVTKGDSISQREALESILIASANNVARLLARWDAGSEKAFVAKMNDAAEDLGMTNTTYTDPSGLNNTTVSTAVDQVKLGKAAMTEPAFREVAAMMSYVDYKGTKHDNWNRLVGYNDVVGIKTGTTTSALGNLVFAAKKDVDGEVHRIVGAVVRQPAGGADNTIIGAALDSSDKLIRAAQDALESATILKKGDVVGYADDGLGGRTPVVATKDVTAVGWAGLTVKLTFAADDLPHTAKAGTQVGSLTVGDGSGSAVKVPVALQKDLVEPGFTDKLTRLG